jgi:replicative DNA helicase
MIPHHPEVEIVLLGSMLEFPEACHQALGLGLRPEDFVSEPNRLLFRTIEQLANAGNPVSYEATLSELRKTANGSFEKFAAVLSDKCDPLHVPRKDVTWHVSQLKNAMRREQFKAACTAALAAAENPSTSTDECISLLDDSLLRLDTESYRGTSVTLRNLLAQGLKNLEHRAQCEGLIGRTTGISTLDEITTGIRDGELCIVGALPGRGKTAFATQMALANAKGGTPTVFFSLEMSRDELSDRFLASESRLTASHIRNPRHIDRDQWLSLANCAGAMAEWPLYVDDSSNLTLQALMSRARLHIRQHGCRLVIVDYIRLIQTPGKELRERIGNAAEALRQLAKREKVAVIALSQLARPKDGDINARPSMIGLKESGDIEASAHVVLLLYTPMENDVPTGQDEIIIGKNRHGSLGAISVFFNRKSLKFFPRS